MDKFATAGRKNVFGQAVKARTWEGECVIQMWQNMAGLKGKYIYIYIIHKYIIYNMIYIYRYYISIYTIHRWNTSLKHGLFQFKNNILGNCIVAKTYSGVSSIESNSVCWNAVKMKVCRKPYFAQQYVIRRLHYSLFFVFSIHLIVSSCEFPISIIDILLWLVVSNICFHILGMSSSQLMNSMIFQRGRAKNHQP